MALRFFSEGIPFKLKNPRKTSNWIKRAIESESRSAGEINYIFCKDGYLKSINKSYLKHDYLTDIITFDHSVGDEISGDIFISVPRVKENASIFGVEFDHELHRVLIHGVLHLIGYRDKKKDEIALMRKKEEAYLSLRH